VVFKKIAWMFGLGTAIDYYKIRTVPVFADVGMHSEKKQTIFPMRTLGPILYGHLKRNIHNIIYWVFIQEYIQ
jgi:hypothetical protein